MENAIKASPMGPAEQHDKQHERNKEAYGEAMLEMNELLVSTLKVRCGRPVAADTPIPGKDSQKCES